MATSSGELFTGEIPLPSFQSQSAPFTTGQLAVFGEASEIIPPALANISPADGSTLPQFGAVGFDITDASGIGFAVVFVIYPDGSSEVVWDGSAFTTDYSTESSCTVITGGNLRFSIKRFAGWAKVPTIRIRAVDTKGNVLL